MKTTTGIALVATIVAGILFYYFGFFGNPFEVSEESDSGTPSVQEIAAGPLAGTWQSTEDPRFTREFTDSAVVDRYEGEQDTPGTWRVFTAADAPSGIAFTPDPHSVYLQITQGGATYTFSVISLSDSEMTLMYMDRGGMLNFKKIP